MAVRISCLGTIAVNKYLLNYGVTSSFLDSMENFVSAIESNSKKEGEDTFHTFMK